VDIIEAINNRRSIRKYKPDPVDDKTIEVLIDAARKAPSWGNSQCWHFIVVSNQEVKEKLADTLFGVTDRPNSVVASLKQAPVTIAICAELKKSGTYHREPAEYATDKGEYWYMFDTALATENLALTAHSMGLGTVIAGAFDAKAAAGILKVPAGFVVVALTPLGYPAEAPNPRPRKELSEIIHKETF
jgi:nitroreductase